MKKKYKGANINLFYLPALLLFLGFVITPLLRGFQISLTTWNGYSPNSTFVGIENYIRILRDPNFRTAFVNTMIYGIGSTFLQNVLGLAYALLLNQKFRGSILVRTIIYIPSMVAGLIMGYIMYFVVQYNNGAINDIMVLLGFEKADIMANGIRAVIVITLINSLQFVGGAMVIYMAGLQSIPDMYYEAASIDGGGRWWKLIKITLPLLTPAISSAVVVNLIGGLKLFDIVNAMTKGGPGFASHSLSTLINYEYVNAESAGYSAAIGMISFLIILIFSNIAITYFNKKEVVM
jgi:raffinose/stachyose/melibiose transport system permease protein